MLSKCSNPGCSAHFRYLHVGRLFRFDNRNGAESRIGTGRKALRGAEFFWLCEGCATKFTLISDAAKGTCVVALQGRALGAAAGL